MNVQHLSPSMSGTALLVAYNRLRESAGMKPLKGWSESKAKLLDAIEKLDNAQAAPAAPPAPVAPPPAPVVVTQPKRPASDRPHGRQRFTNRATITVVQLRSAKKNTGRNPYEHYATGRTVAELLALGVRRRDINYDVDAGHITVTEPTPS